MYIQELAQTLAFFFIQYALVYRTHLCFTEFFLYPFLYEIRTIVKELTPSKFCIIVQISCRYHVIVWYSWEGINFSCVLLKIWYLYCVIKLSIMINSTRVTFIRNQTHVFSPSFKNDANFSVYSLKPITLIYMYVYIKVKANATH